MAQSTCRVEECKRNVNSYGYCGMHWLRLQRNGDVLDPGAFTYSETGLCTVEACGRKHVAKGYCSMHYQRVKAGRPLEMRESLDCDWCGSTFPRPYKANPETVRFCSHECRYANQLKQSAERYPELYARNVEWRRNNPDALKAILTRRRAAKRAASVHLVTGRDIEHLVTRHGGKCAYCRVAPYQHLDHVVPLSRGGMHRIGNLLPACESCNLTKAARFVSEWRYLRPVPRRFRANQ